MVLLTTRETPALLLGSPLMVKKTIGTSSVFRYQAVSGVFSFVKDGAETDAAETNAGNVIVSHCIRETAKM